MFYHLNGIYHFDRCEIDKTWYALVKSRFCSECIRTYHDGPIDATISGKLEGVALTGLGAVYIGIAAKAFIDRLPKFSDLFFLGKVFSTKGTLYPDHVTFIGKHGIFNIRGNKDSPFRVCEKCGRHVYYPFGKRGDAYILRQKLPEHPISHSNGNQLLVTKEIYERLDFTPWKRKPDVVPIPVVDEPRDGINLIF